MNYFASPEAAERYARHRPYFHPLVMEKARAFLNLREPVPLAVDVACGAGQSALALTALARKVIATDLSASMLAMAPKHPGIEYIEAPAEQLPLADGIADLMTVSLAFHWLDRPRFLAEAHRILRPEGALIIYTNDYRGAMNGNAAFSKWSTEEYIRRFPIPPRNAKSFSDEDAREHGFTVSGRERYLNRQVFSPEQLVGYLTTHSNIIAAVEQRGESLMEIRAHLLETVRPFFPAPAAGFEFGGEIIYARPSQEQRSQNRRVA